MVHSAAAALGVRIRHAEHVMGTVVSFDVPGSARRDGSLDAAIGWLHWADRVFSPYRADSDVSLLARAEITVDACVPEMAEVLAACAFVRDLSGGYFTAAPGGQFAFPKLIGETLSAQSARIDSVSGATYTSGGYIKSLQSALDNGA